MQVNALAMMMAWLVAFGQPQTLPVRMELARLQGTWHVVELTADGQKAPPEEDVFLEYVFRGQNLRVKGEDVDEEVVFQINPDASLKFIDVTNARQPGPVTSGIYKVDGDDLVICLSSEAGA